MYHKPGTSFFISNCSHLYSGLCVLLPTESFIIIAKVINNR